MTWNWDISEKDTITITYGGIVGGETISASEWTLGAGLVNEDASISGNQVSLKLSFNGATVPVKIKVRNRITTTGHPNGARTIGKSIYLLVNES